MLGSKVRIDMLTGPQATYFGMKTATLRAAIVLACLILAGCETLDSTAPSPMFDQALIMNGHYSLVYPNGK
jgi:hypothetical protein